MQKHPEAAPTSTDVLIPGDPTVINAFLVPFNNTRTCEVHRNAVRGLGGAIRFGCLMLVKNVFDVQGCIFTT